MPHDPADLKHLWDMLDAARRVMSHVAGMTEAQFLNDDKTRDAVERRVEVLGEAARRVSEAGRSAASGVPWGAIVATRHILAHDYDEVNPQTMWRIAAVHVPALIEAIMPILDANPPGPEAERNPCEP